MMLNKLGIGLLTLVAVSVTAFASDNPEKILEQKEVKGAYGRLQSSVRLDTTTTQDDGGPMSFLILEEPQPQQNNQEHSHHNRPQCFSASRFAVHCMH